MLVHLRVVSLYACSHAPWASLRSPNRAHMARDACSIYNRALYREVSTLALDETTGLPVSAEPS